MNRRNYIIVILLIIAWSIEDIYHLAPRDYRISPFFFSVKDIKIRAYIYDITSHLQQIIYLSCILIINPKPYWLVKDVVIMTLILKILSLYWYISKYGNPYYHSEWYVVSISAVVIFVCLEAIKLNERNNPNNISD